MNKNLNQFTDLGVFMKKMNLKFIQFITFTQNCLLPKKSFQKVPNWKPSFLIYLHMQINAHMHTQKEKINRLLFLIIA